MISWCSTVEVDQYCFLSSRSVDPNIALSYILLILFFTIFSLGTVNPTSYNVVKDSSGLKPEHLQKLTYKLTHLYYNWPGDHYDQWVSSFTNNLLQALSEFQLLASMLTSSRSWWGRVFIKPRLRDSRRHCSTSRLVKIIAPRIGASTLRQSVMFNVLHLQMDSTWLSLCIDVI